MSAYASKTIVGVVIAVALGVALLVGVTYLPLGAPSNAGNNTSSIYCLVEVPISAPIETFQNSTIMGYKVSYANGSSAVFTVNMCPIPVHSELFSIAPVIENSPRFIAAENGTRIPVVPFVGGYSADINGSTINYSVIQFILFSNQKVYPCGLNGYWTYDELDQIQVSIPTDAKGNYIFSNMIIQRLAPASINIFHCTTTANSNTTTA